MTQQRFKMILFQHPSTYIPYEKGTEALVYFPSQTNIYRTNSAPNLTPTQKFLRYCKDKRKIVSGWEESTEGSFLASPEGERKGKKSNLSSPAVRLSPPPILFYFNPYALAAAPPFPPSSCVYHRRRQGKTRARSVYRLLEQTGINAL